MLSEKLKCLVQHEEHAKIATLELLYRSSFAVGINNKQATTKHH